MARGPTAASVPTTALGRWPWLFGPALRSSGERVVALATSRRKDSITRQSTRRKARQRARAATGAAQLARAIGLQGHGTSVQYGRGALRSPTPAEGREPTIGLPRSPHRNRSTRAVAVSAPIRASTT